DSRDALAADARRPRRIRLRLGRFPVQGHDLPPDRRPDDHPDPDLARSPSEALPPVAPQHAALRHRRVRIRRYLARAHGVRTAARDLPAAELLHYLAEGSDRGRADGRRLEHGGLPANRAAAVRAGTRVVRDLPVPVGLERPPDGPDLSLRRADPTADDRAHPVLAVDVWTGVPPVERGVVPVDVPPARRVLCAAALLRAGTAGGLVENLTVCP